MTDIDYIMLVNDFYARRRTSRITSAEADLYMYVLHLLNECGTDKVELTSRETELMLGMSRQTLAKAREGLVWMGLIEAEVKNGRNGSCVYGIKQTFGKTEGMVAETDGEAEGTVAMTEGKPSGTVAGTVAEVRLDVMKVDDDMVEKVWRCQQGWIETVCMKKRMSPGVLREWMVKFVDTLQCDAVERKQVQDFMHHFNRWLDIEIDKQKQKTNGNKNISKSAQRDSEAEQRNAEAMGRIGALQAQWLAEHGEGGTAEGSANTYAFSQRLESQCADYPFK